MIPAIAALGVQAALSLTHRASPHAAAPAPSGAGGRGAEGGGSIASDLGRLTTDALQLLGLGGAAPGNPGQAAQAYAATGK